MITSCIVCFRGKEGQGEGRMEYLCLLCLFCSEKILIMSQSPGIADN